jgi:putative peptide maturation dehydrogenase
VQLEDRLVPDIAKLLRAEMALTRRVCAELLCPINAERISLERRDLEILAQLSASEWSDSDALVAAGIATPEEIADLVERGVILADADTPAQRRLVDGEQRLERIGWHDLAAIYHSFSSWDSIETKDPELEPVAATNEDRLANHVRKYGLPPPHFVHRDGALAEIALDPTQPEDDFFRAMAGRMTTRAYRRDVALDRKRFDLMMRAVFGAQGIRELSRGITAIKKTSASGGGLHPTEAYVLVQSVEGLEPGLYHYQVRTHSLVLIERLDAKAIHELATKFVAGQDYFVEAHVLVILVARFHRHFWKYVEHLKAFKAVLMDSAHLSQTLYLTAAHLGLGGFFTAAINDASIGKYLGLDHLEEGVIAVTGFGVPDRTRTELQFNPDPYDPARPEARL